MMKRFFFISHYRIVSMTVLVLVSMANAHMECARGKLATQGMLIA